MKRTTTLLFLTLFLLLATTSYAQRVKQSINTGWQFALTDDESASKIKFSDRSWNTVSIPHTWNAEDCNDEKSGYYKGKGWYRRYIKVEPLIENQRVTIYFEGANQVTNVYVNGTHIGDHKGGYTAFSFDITDYVKVGEPNLVSICVDNSINQDITPVGGDWTFFGGIYRDLYLLYTPATSISTSHFASSGVYLTTPEVSDNKAVVKAKTYLSNTLPSTQSLILETEIVDAEGKVVAQSKEKVKIQAKSENVIVETDLSIANPTRWDVDATYLYSVSSRLLTSKGEEIDCVVNPLGIREFSIDPDKGFKLNGRYIKLMGTNRHQCYLTEGNALRDEMHERDLRVIKEMGSNFLRIAHYPQDPAVTQACDQLGILNSIEIPIVGEIIDTEAFSENCLLQAQEMVYQSYNHPSVVIWAYMNEVLLRCYRRISDEEILKEHIKKIYELGVKIEDIFEEMDPDRLTMIPCHSGPDSYRSAGLTTLPDILGFNMYRGWYNSNMQDCPVFMDNLHSMFPDKPLIITEFGAGVDPRVHSLDPVRFDFSCEYAEIFHETYAKSIMERDFVAGGALWNFNDFLSEGRRDAVPHVNSKGITGTDRERKSSYHYYQALLRKDPIVNIAQESWMTRAGASEDGITSTQSVHIYTNAPQVEIIHNGESLGTVAVNGIVAMIDVPFTNGRNTVDAVINVNGKEYRDQYVCDFSCINVKKNFTQMSVNLGAKTFFEDRTAELCWIPRQAYTEGSWGFVGGDDMHFETRYGGNPTSSADIKGTTHDPLFQSCAEGIEAFKADVYDGSYAVYLYFAELTSNMSRPALIYNLGNDEITKKYENRVFSIDINGTCVEQNVNIAEEYGSSNAVIKKFVVSATNGEGITVSFKAIESQPILNAIRIVKN